MSYQSKKELARQALATMISLSKTAGMDTDSSRENSPEYYPKEAPYQQNSYNYNNNQRRESSRRNNMSTQLPTTEEGEEMEYEEPIQNQPLESSGYKRPANSSTAPPAPPSKKPAPARQRSNSKSVHTLPVNVQDYPKRGRTVKVPTTSFKTVYESRGVSPSESGPSKGWESNFVVQNEPAAGGGPALIELKNKKAESLVNDSQSESINENEMKDEFTKRLKFMDERGLLYFADAANDFVGSPVIFRGAQVTFPRARATISLQYSRSAIVNILSLAKKLRLLKEDYMAKDWLSLHLKGTWENIEFCSKFTENKLPDLHTYVIGKNIEKYNKLTDEQKQDLDFLPISDTGRNDLETNMRRLKDSLLELNRKLASVHKEPKSDESVIFDNTSIKAFSSNTDEFVNRVLALTGYKELPAGQLEKQIYGYSTKAVATIIISTVVAVIPLIYGLENSAVVRKLLFDLLNTDIFKRIIGTSFAIGCSESVAIFIGEIVSAAGKTLELTESQLSIIRDNICDVAKLIAGNQTKSHSNNKALIVVFDELAHHWAYNPRHNERAASESYELRAPLHRKSARLMRDESEDARNELLDTMLDDESSVGSNRSRRPSIDEEEEEYYDEDDNKMKIGKGGRRVTKRRKQKKTKTVKRKRRTAKK
uniref:Uncharacterized protein n=1 Tax=viral metagenome TaxID=1070528 RepID=A0A6C0B9B5_9ZZZZ